MTQEENMPGQDDQAWFDALSGKADNGQGALLRHVLREVEIADASQEDVSHDWQRLQFAIRREEAKQKRQAGMRYFAVAASLVLVVSTVFMLVPMNDGVHPPRTDDGAVMRGKTEQVIFSATPDQEAKQLESDLVQLGVKVVRRGTAEKTELQISLSYPVTTEVRAVLEARTIPVPDEGNLIVVFMQRTR